MSEEFDEIKSASSLQSIRNGWKTLAPGRALICHAVT